MVEEVLAEIFDVSQPTISRAICDLTPVIEKVTDEFRPTAEEATAAVRKTGNRPGRRVPRPVLVLEPGPGLMVRKTQDHRTQLSGDH